MVESIWFDSLISCGGTNAVRLVRFLYESLNVDRRVQQNKFIECGHIVLANLHAIYLESFMKKNKNSISLAVPLDKNVYIGRSKVSAQNISRCLKVMKRHGYIDIWPGYHDRSDEQTSRVTRVYLRRKMLIFFKSSILTISCLEPSSLVKLKDETTSVFVKRPIKIVNPMNSKLKIINKENSMHSVILKRSDLIDAFIQRLHKDYDLVMSTNPLPNQCSVDLARGLLGVPGYEALRLPPRVLERARERLFSGDFGEKIKIHKEKDTKTTPKNHFHEKGSKQEKTGTRPQGLITKSIFSKATDTEEFNNSGTASILQRFFRLLALIGNDDYLSLTPFLGSIRIFSRGSFKYGGRFFGSVVLELPKEARPFIVIDNEPSVELDFNAMHIRMLYHRNGIEIDFDPYYVKVNGIRIERHLAKRAVNILLNAKSLTSATRALAQEHLNQADWAYFKAIVHAVTETHHPIAKFLGGDEGVRLQRIESDIAEKVMLAFAKSHECCLCVHDSFIVKESLGSFLKEKMVDSYREVLGKGYSPTIS